MLALLFFSSPANAIAFGGSVLLGPAVTLPATVTTTTTGPLGAEREETVEFHPGVGPLAELQVELGDRFISALAVQYSNTPIRADSGGTQVTGREGVILAGYRFTFDLFGRSGKHAVSPYAGVGTLFGVSAMSLSASNDVETAVSEGTALTLVVDATLGAHWRLNEHLGLRGEVTASSYGGLGAIEPRVGAYAMF